MDPRCTEACREIFLPRDYRIADLSVSVAGLCPGQAIRGRCLAIWVVDRPRVPLSAGERDELVAAIRSHLR